jgi:pilus assembly protein Flp/PilA
MLLATTTAHPYFLELLFRLLADESGQDLIEYALVAATIGLGTVAGVNGLAVSVAKDMNLLLTGFNAALAGHI